MKHYWKLALGWAIAAALVSLPYGKDAASQTAPRGELKR